jgi:Tannase and feruloyl esterase
MSMGTLLARAIIPRLPLSRRLAAAAAAGLAVGGLVYAPTATGAAGIQPARDCQGLSITLQLPNTTVNSAVAVAATSTVPAYCAVQLTVSNPPSADAVHVGVFMPMSTWNGRFEGLGGGGYSGGDPTAACSPDFVPCPLQQGYASAATDAGNAAADITDGSFALNASGRLNWQLINDFGFLGIHEMTETAKSVIAAFYGTGPRFSYFNGCSTGGRQGLMEAQRYPADYDGIASGAPAINWTKFVPSQLWGQLQMNLAHDFIPQCKFAAANSAAIAACDGLDGVDDGIISDWQACQFDARRLVGAVTPCGAITATDADLINRMWQGPRDANGRSLWFGLLRGASFARLDSTVTGSDGTTTPAAFPLMVSWFQNWLAQNPGLDWRTIPFDQYLEFFQQSVSEFGFPIATDDPNLTGFRGAGGKIVIWHGTYDTLIAPQGTVDYYRRVVQTMGGLEQTDRFARLFLAPGAQHCGGAAGPAPDDPFGAVVSWVEHHQAPGQLLGTVTNASGDVVMTRPICAFPLVARFKGHGSVNAASNFVCSKTFGPRDG